MAVESGRHVSDVPISPTMEPNRRDRVAVSTDRRPKHEIIGIIGIDPMALVTGVICFHSDDINEPDVTGQVVFDSYIDAGAFVAADLVNALAPRQAGAKRAAPAALLPALADALADDPPSVARLRQRDVPRFAELAERLRAVFEKVDAGDPDGAASLLNRLLATNPAHPYLAKEDGRWRMHHHSSDAALVPMWASICAENLARMFGAGIEDRLGTCAVEDCRRVFVDVSKNGSRRFCSTSCQNRVKSAAFRLRRASRGA